MQCHGKTRIKSKRNALLSPINHFFPKLPCDLPLPLFPLSIVEGNYMGRVSFGNRCSLRWSSTMISWTGTRCCRVSMVSVNRSPSTTRGHLTDVAGHVSCPCFMSRSIGNGEESLLWWHCPGIPESNELLLYKEWHWLPPSHHAMKHQSGWQISDGLMVFHPQLDKFPDCQAGKFLMDSSFLFF